MVAPQVLFLLPLIHLSRAVLSERRDGNCTNESECSLEGPSQGRTVLLWR